MIFCCFFSDRFNNLSVFLLFFGMVAVVSINGSSSSIGFVFRNGFFAAGKIYATSSAAVEELVVSDVACTAAMLPTFDTHARDAKLQSEFT